MKKKYRLPLFCSETGARLRICPTCFRDLNDFSKFSSKLGKLSAKKRFAEKTEKEKSEIMKELAIKRWSNPRN